jgi:hypothetical protein
MKVALNQLSLKRVVRPLLYVVVALELLFVLLPSHTNRIPLPAALKTQYQVGSLTEYLIVIGVTKKMNILTNVVKDCVVLVSYEMGSQEGFEQYLSDLAKQFHSRK